MPGFDPAQRLQLLAFLEFLVTPVVAHREDYDQIDLLVVKS
jgi:hypothetical protein